MILKTVPNATTQIKIIPTGKDSSDRDYEYC